MSLEEMLGKLQREEIDRLEGKQLDLTERVYPSLPATIKRTAELTGIDEEVLISSCISAAYHYKDLEWYHVLDIVRSVYLAKRNIEERNQ